MAEPIVSIEFEDSRVQELFSQLRSRIGDLTEPHQEIGEYLIGEIDEQFRTERDPYGVPWLPNSPRTTSLKQAQGKILKVLQRTGYMRSTVNYSAKRDRVVIGLTDPKSAKHQLGRGVPKREILGINDKNISYFLEIYSEYLNS